MNNAHSILVSIGPFLLLLVLWYIVLRVNQSKRFSTKTFIDEAIQTQVVPEIRALRESVDSLRTDLKAVEEKRG